MFNDEIKKIVKTKDFCFFLVIQILLIVGALWLVISSYNPVRYSETHQIRLYSPSVSLESKDGWGKHDRKIIIISYGEYEFVYASHVHSNKKDNTDDTLYEQLQMEPYLDIVYITSTRTYRIVEIYGNEHAYYTLDDYNKIYSSNLISSIILAIFCEAIFVYFVTFWIKYYILKRPFPVSKRLRKKHPVEKHVYYDEENEFSPYKQKLIEQEREEE